MTPTASDSPDTPASAASAPAGAPDATTPAGRRPRRGGSRGAGQARGPAAATAENRPAEGRGPRQHPVLDQLATLYPQLFGETLRPLKRGIFQDLLAAQPEVLDKDGLKAALALHTRSSRYLTVVASGMQRHDLDGQPVEDLTPEQVHHALIEVFRRRGSRSREDLRPKLRQRILQAFEASGLTREDYALRMMGRDEEVNQLTRDALAEAAVRAARDEALLRTFEASGLTVEAFADMYGLHVLDANRTLERARARAAVAASAASAVVAAATPETTAPEAGADQADEQA
ncbi:MAG: ProQ/FINO family protein [Hydrogenophaga sp.]|nr:ProQ/FINO family protein [Hydrogenophaga sp.]